MKELAIQQQQLVEESMSKLTSAYGEASASPNQQSFASPKPNVKKKRSRPGNPDPDAEVIALSPKTLMATNRFICEVCNKGFPREQNLQLHRRCHNLPGKLKQRSSKEVKKKVYVCPKVSCVHHDPSRALGDLTGIKKHYSRKHGEKKWKCDKCDKKYAVESDWMSHSKICGTREYRCDCGALFSRRDSLTMHKALCDALNARSTTGSNPFAEAHHPLMFSQLNVSLDPLAPPLPSPYQASTAAAHMSATALLQMGATMNGQHYDQMATHTIGNATANTAGFGLGFSSQQEMDGGGDGFMQALASSDPVLYDIMMSLEGLEENIGGSNTMETPARKQGVSEEGGNGGSAG